MEKFKIFITNHTKYSLRFTIITAYKQSVDVYKTSEDSLEIGREGEIESITIVVEEESV